jgi:hypothetical protein
MYGPTCEIYKVHLHLQNINHLITVKTVPVWETGHSDFSNLVKFDHQHMPLCLLVILTC